MTAVVATPPFVDASGTLIDPAAAAVVRAIERENVRRLVVSTQLDRVVYFEARIRDRGLTPDQWLIVILNVDDANGAALADVLMPGHDWSAIRATGQVPFARGLASRPAIQETLTDTPAGAELSAIEGVAVLAMDRGVIAAFTLDELELHPVETTS